MQIIDKKLAELIPYENNPRDNDEAVPYVANSIKEFGFNVPIVIDKDNVIVAGHTRYKACQQLGIDTVPCIVKDDLTDDQIKAYRLADNKVAEKAAWDIDLLDLEIEEIELDMTEFGFEEVSIDNLDDTFDLPDGGKGDIVQITFTLHEEQAAHIRAAMERVKDEVTETFGNTNRNGNEIYEVIRQWEMLKR